MRTEPRRHVVAAFATSIALLATSVSLGAPRTEVQIVLDQAEAALAILTASAEGRTPPADAWGRLFASEGYRRLRERQESFGASDVDDWMRGHLENAATVARVGELEVAVERWRTLDTGELGRRALRYLPAGTRLTARLYPVIKSSPNSFVWQLDSDPAIFAYVDPARSAEQMANTMVHELHHVGAGSCPQPPGRDALPAGAQNALDWSSAFAEGIAMLAAAGSPDVHPHATSEADARAVWERDIARFGDDLRALDSFFLGLVDELWDPDEQRERGFRFINTAEVPQGAFYTVGWKMAVLVERVRGRERVVAAVCDPRVLLREYDRIATELSRSDAAPLLRWSPGLLRSIGVVEPPQ